MEKPQNFILTLKNIYRMLTQPDFPAFSYPVFPKNAMQGQTLVKFWSELFREALPPGTDLSLFDLTLTRNRSLTRLLNRTGGFNFYEKWFTALSDELSPDLLLNMVHTWSRQLEERHYAPQALTQRLQLFVGEIIRAKELNYDELNSFFQNLIRSLSARTGTGSTGAYVPLLFRHSYVLSWLTLYALYGSRLQDIHLSRLRTTGSGMRELYQKDLQQKLVPAPLILTSRQCTLCSDPLLSSQYVGCQGQLSQTIDLLTSGHHKLAVTGIRGIGKSEFVRQLLAKLLAQGLYQRLAFVQYEHSLIESFRRAFPSSLPETDAACLEQVARLLEPGQEGRTLLLLDHLDIVPSEDPNLAILPQLGCDVIITTCLTEINSFTMIPLSGLNVPESRQLFSLHCRSTSNKVQDIDALCTSVAGHPLAITLLASVCRTRFWTAEHLCEELIRSGFTGLTYVRHAVSVRLEDAFSEVFDTSGLASEQLMLLQLLALLPARSWLPEELLPFAGDICKDAITLASLCHMLADQSWLEVSGKGYALHPLIARTLRTRPVDADAFHCFLKALNTSSDSDLPRYYPYLVASLPGIGLLNFDAVCLLAKLESQMSFVPGIFLPDRLFESQRLFLSAHKRTCEETLDFQIGMAMRDLIQDGRRDRLHEYIQAMAPLLRPAKKSPACLESIGYILELGCTHLAGSLCTKVLSMIRPPNQDSSDTVSYLITAAAVHRTCMQDPQEALDMLGEAQRQYEALGLHSPVLQSRLMHLTAQCMSDMNHPLQARQMLESGLSLMQGAGYQDNCYFMLHMRTSYARILMQAGDSASALHEFRYVSSLYESQYKKAHPDYSVLRSMMSLALLRNGRTDEARTVIMGILNAGMTQSLPAPETATCHLNAAEILCSTDEYTQARIHAEKALTLRSTVFGPESPWTADAQAVFAYILFRQGQTQRAMELLDSACRIMDAAWKPWNERLLHAHELRSAIEPRW